MKSIYIAVSEKYIWKSQKAEFRIPSSLILY